MNRPIHATTPLAIAAVMALAGPALAQAPPKPVALPAPTAPAASPEALLPTRIAGSAFYVNDLEAQREWYETMLGLRVLTTYQAGGKTFEYVMGRGNGGAILALMKAQRPPGSNAFSRVIIETPNPKGLADHLYGEGVYVRQAIRNVAYFVLDPEGNQIELFSLKPPAPTPGQ